MAGAGADRKPQVSAEVEVALQAGDTGQRRIGGLNEWHHPTTTEDKACWHRRKEDGAPFEKDRPLFCRGNY